MAPLSDKMLALISEKNMDKDSPILVRIFKEESEMEVWKQTRDGTYALLKTYPICKWSGELGPKKKEGDRQAPEGFYSITPAQMNPHSNYYLSFNTGYPNAYDRAWGRTGSELMVHGDCSSRGCYAMTDEQIQEIYALARDSFFGGQKEFQLEAFPFRMTALNMAKHRNNPNFAFWKMLKEGYDDFNATHQEPKVAVCEKHYVFDAAAPEGASHPLSFSPRGKCPAYRLDPAVADAVLDHRRQEQLKMAEYIAEGVPTVPVHRGVDGGMNPVFAAELGTPHFDNSGHVSASNVPGALPRVSNLPADAVLPQPTAPVRMASVPVPTPAPLSKQGKADGGKPSAIVSLFGGLFGHSAKPAGNESKQIALRGSRREPTARSKKTTRHRQPERTPPKAVARNVPASEPKAQHKPEAAPIEKQAVALAKPDQSNPAPASAPEPPIRSAFSDTAGASGVMTGAQPILPASSFEARWAGLR
jgi:murein L,D-transpeptidase YafK